MLDMAAAQASNGLAEHLQALLGRPSGSSRTLDFDQSLIDSLHASVQSLGASATHPSPTELEQEQIENSIWIELAHHARAQDVDGISDDYSEDDDYQGEHGGPSSPAVAQLVAHLDSVSINDSAIAASLKQTILDALKSSKGADEVSIELAEVLGFEHLDLVSQILADRPNVALALSGSALAAPTEPSPARISIAPSASLQPSHPTQGVRVSAKPYVPGSQVVVQTSEDKAIAKRIRNEHRKANKARAAATTTHADGGIHEYTMEELEQLRELSLIEAANRPLYSGTATSMSEPQYPHVFSSGAHGNVLSAFGQKFALPVGTTRVEEKFYEEITIPPPRTVPMRINERFIPIQEMDTLCRGAFPGYKSLNRLQSVVYPLAYKSNENLLVCAPTGAGKTDVAMLTVLRAISQYARNIEPVAGKGAEGFGINLNDFKIVYVAPMKALAAEVVRKFSKRLQYLGIKVRELTGDMQMTRQEIAETQMIVTTPEKWDVVTRKPTGEGELATKVRLLIIDEVHLLHEERGAVIETIVARTLRLVESSQSLIRIVGLSATLPNYIDVADFLRVNRYQGLFYFDSSFRPVPLEQHFIGVRGKAGSQQARANLDKATFEKVSELVQAGHQVMVFVHARKETVKTAQTLTDMFKDEGLSDFLTSAKDEHPRLSFFKKELQASRNKELKELFESGFGIHHAGMLRSDRNISERMFEAGVTRVLCCTATLAWGVNLPAYAVVIKGTEVYDSSVGKFVDLSILDVLQIFGRAGRPQYEDLGVGYICTSQDRLSHYVDAITSQHPIESKFIGGLIDSLNAEVSLGTVTSIRDGISWLGYTYLFTRMKRTPLTYGMVSAEVEDDPHLGAKRTQLITFAAKKLVEAKMLRHDEATGHLEVTELGRIAAKYYIGYRTIEIFNEKLRPRMSEADVLGILSLATDFEQIIPRDSEEKELKRMLENAPCEVPGGIETSPGKVNILLQAYISRTFVEDFALVSDSAYVAQNAGRTIRALLEIALSHRWATTTAALMSMSKAIERRMWPFDHPLSQSNLTPDSVYNLTRWADEVEVAELARMSAADLGKLVHLNERMGNAIRHAARCFPSLSLETELRPLTHNLLRIDVRVRRAFEWNERLHGRTEAFYVWIEDEEEAEILKWTTHLARATEARDTTLSFIISVPDTLPGGINVRWISDRWIGSEDSSWVSFENLRMPPQPPQRDHLLDLPLLPISTGIPDELLSALYQPHMTAFNALQTQSFHTVFHTKADALLCAPSASGKTTVAQFSVWRAIRESPDRAVIIVYPRKELAEAESGPRGPFASIAKQKDVTVCKSLTTNSLQRALARVEGPTVLITSALPWMRLQSIEGPALISRISLVVAEDLHLLDATYELALSQFLFGRAISGLAVRLVGTSSSLDDASGLSDWLGIKKEARYHFDPRDRPSPLGLSFQTFDLPHSTGLLKTMIKPAYDKMKESAINGPAIVFVPSRAQCFSVAADLVTRTASELDTEAFLGLPAQDLEAVAHSVRDPALYEPLMHGIGIYFDGMAPQDLALTVHLFEQGAIKVLVAPREGCWSLPVRAHLVVVMSTQYVRLVQPHGMTPTRGDQAKGGPAADRQVVDYSLAELIRMQACAIRPGTVDAPSPPGDCLVLCQTDRAALLGRMMQAGQPLHSALLEDETRPLLPMVLQHVVSGSITSRGDLLGLLSWTLLAVEASRNPSYYDAAGTDAESVSARLSAHADALLDELEGLKAVRIHRQGKSDSERDSVEPTNFGRALQLQPGPTVVHVARWHGRLSQDAPKAAAFCKSFGPPVKAGMAQTPLADPAESEVLEATRSITPGEWLAAFKVPRGAKVLRSERDQAKEDSAASKHGAEQATEADSGAEEFTSDTKRQLLLATFFAKRPLCTTGEAAVIKYPKGKAGKKVEHASEKGRAAFPESRQAMAKEKLESEQASAVLELLESTSGVSLSRRRVA